MGRRIGLCPQLGADVSDITQQLSLKTGSKLALLAQRLKGAGATISDLTTATGWQAHTIRSAITGLRKRGFQIERTRSGRTDGSIYRLATPSQRKRRSK